MANLRNYNVNNSIFGLATRDSPAKDKTRYKQRKPSEVREFERNKKINRCEHHIVLHQCQSAFPLNLRFASLLVCIKMCCKSLANTLIISGTYSKIIWAKLGPGISLLRDYIAIAIANRWNQTPHNLFLDGMVLSFRGPVKYVRTNEEWKQKNQQCCVWRRHGNC